VSRLHAVAILALGGLAAPLSAEPMFLSRQYTRCANCHYSPTGGGLLTPYGRSLSREELSTFGRSPGGTPKGREHEFLFGALGDRLGPLSLGVSLRPSHLEFDFGNGSSSSRDLLMNADVTAALRTKGFTFYAELGRQPRGDDPRVASFEHWVGYESEGGWGARAGRFLPAYGVRFADHTTFTRAPLELDNEDQVYALELSHRGDRHLLQVSVGPGRADDVDDAEARSFTASGRAQLDLGSRTAVVASGLYRDSSELEPARGSTGLALGVAPLSRLTLWAQGDLRFRDDGRGHAYAAAVDAAFEAYRGVWLRVSPQLLTEYGNSSGGIMRWSASLDWLIRTHANVVVSYFHDDARQSDFTQKTLLLQLHLYL
jgi:hypothetical protein